MYDNLFIILRNKYELEIQVLHHSTPCHPLSHTVYLLISVHVRRTDKVGSEAAFHHIEEYMKHVEHYFSSLDVIRGHKVVRRIYLATDASTLIKDTRTALALPLYPSLSTPPHRDPSLSTPLPLYPTLSTPPPIPLYPSLSTPPPLPLPPLPL